MRTHRTAAILTAAFALTTSQAQAQTRTDTALTRIAAQATHGWTQDTLPLPVLEHKLNHGDRIYVTCGTISRLAVRRLHRMGVRARLVGTYTLDTPNGKDDGHIMIEAFTQGRWQVYDLDNNRQPVDRHGRGITVAQFARDPRREYRVLADDRTVSWTGTNYRAAHDAAYGTPDGLERWYDHILGVPTILTRAGWVADTRDPAMIHRMAGYQFLSRAGFAALERF